MNALTQKALMSMIPAAAYGLNVLVPIVPAFIWSALLNGLIGGDLTLEHIQEFLDEHNIKTYQEFPEQKDGAFEKPPSNVKNFNKG